nr:MAG: capsid protein [Cressdnaviricota sp.]
MPPFNFKRKRSSAPFKRAGTRKLWPARKPAARSVGVKRVFSRSLPMRRGRAKAGSFSRRKPFQSSRPAFRRILHKNLLDAVPSHSFKKAYLDTVSIVGTTNSEALAGTWATRLVSATLGGAAPPPVNLQLHPVDLYQQIMGTMALDATAITNKIVVRDLVQRCRVTNMSTGPCILYAYRVRARRDLSVGASINGITNILSAGYGDALAGTASGDAVYTSPMSVTSLLATPYDNPRFVATCKILSCRRKEMPPGTAVTFKVSARKPRIINNETYNAGQEPQPTGTPATDRQILKGQSFTVFRAHGTIASSTSASAGNTVGLGNVSLGLIYETHCRWSMLTPNATYTAMVNQVPGFSANADSFPAPLVLNKPLAAISVGAAAQGATVYGTNGPAAVVDTTMYAS